MCSSPCDPFISYSNRVDPMGPHSLGPCWTQRTALQLKPPNRECISPFTRSCRNFDKCEHHTHTTCQSWFLHIWSCYTSSTFDINLKLVSSFSGVRSAVLEQQAIIAIQNFRVTPLTQNNSFFMENAFAVPLATKKAQHKPITPNFVANQKRLQRLLRIAVLRDGMTST